MPGLKRCVHISSDAVLGVAGLVSPPNASGGTGPPLDPKAVPAMSMYALAKVGGEAAVQRWKTLYGMDVVSVRFSDVYVLHGVRTAFVNHTIGIEFPHYRSMKLRAVGTRVRFVTHRRPSI